MADDALVVNRQAELPDLLSRADYGRDYAQLPKVCAQRIDRALTALGVGKPEQKVREVHLKRGEEYVEAADRIERAIGEKP